MRFVRRWWMTFLLNAIIVAALATGCAEGERRKAELAAPPDTARAIVLVGRDLRHPVARQDSWWWEAPVGYEALVVSYSIEYQRRDLTWVIYTILGRDPPWKHLGVSANNTVLVPQLLAPYRIRVWAYFDERPWIADNSAGYGPASVPSDWVEIPTTK